MLMANLNEAYRLISLQPSVDCVKSYINFSLYTFCFLLALSLQIAEVKSIVTDSPTSRSYVVVFDIDDTLCAPSIDNDQVTQAKKSYPECPIINWKNRDKAESNVFIPHLQVLFDYLLGKSVRIVFFSTGNKERDEAVISDLLTNFWGSEKFEALNAKDQFAVFSKADLRNGNVSLREKGVFVKDLNIVLRNGESLSDAILVEDDQSYVADDQKPCLQIIDLLTWDLFKGSTSNFPLNNVYYMLGVFKSYFEDEKYKNVPLRMGIKQIVPTGDLKTRQSFVKHPFVMEMIEIGRKEVQKHVANATLYDNCPGRWEWEK